MISVLLYDIIAVEDYAQLHVFKQNNKSFQYGLNG